MVLSRNKSSWCLLATTGNATFLLEKCCGNAGERWCSRLPVDESHGEIEVLWQGSRDDVEELLVVDIFSTAAKSTDDGGDPVEEGVHGVCCGPLDVAEILLEPCDVVFSRGLIPFTETLQGEDSRTLSVVGDDEVEWMSLDNG